METDIQKNDKGLEEVSFFTDNSKPVDPNMRLVSSSEWSIAKGINLKIRESDLVEKPICRICFGGSSKECLLRPCRCKGTIEFVHRRCLERWLGSTNSEACELCRFQYNTIRTPKTFRDWCSQKKSCRDRRDITIGVVYFVFLTLMVGGTLWLCAKYFVQSNVVERVILMVTSILLVLMYLFWLVICIRFYCNLWREWRSENFNVRVMNRNPGDEDGTQLVNADQLSRGNPVPRPHPLANHWLGRSSQTSTQFATADSLSSICSFNRLRETESLLQ